MTVFGHNGLVVSPAPPASTGSAAMIRLQTAPTNIGNGLSFINNGLTSFSFPSAGGEFICNVTGLITRSIAGGVKIGFWNPGGGIISRFSQGYYQRKDFFIPAWGNIPLGFDTSTAFAAILPNEQPYSFSLQFHFEAQPNANVMDIVGGIYDAGGFMTVSNIIAVCQKYSAN